MFIRVPRVVITFIANDSWGAVGNSTDNGCGRGLCFPMSRITWKMDTWTSFYSKPFGGLECRSLKHHSIRMQSKIFGPKLLQGTFALQSLGSAYLVVEESAQVLSRTWCTLRQTNIAMKNGPGLKMYFLLNMGMPRCSIPLLCCCFTRGCEPKMLASLLGSQGPMIEFYHSAKHLTMSSKGDRCVKGVPPQHSSGIYRGSQPKPFKNAAWHPGRGKVDPPDVCICGNDGSKFPWYMQFVVSFFRGIRFLYHFGWFSLYSFACLVSHG